MTEDVFACFNPSVTRLKIVRMTEISGAVTRLEAFHGELGGTMSIRTSREPAPTLTAILLESGERLYLWRTSMCVYHRSTGTWIHILDSNRMTMIPGEFTYRETCMSRLCRGSRERRCTQLRREMLRCIREREEMYTPSVAALPPSAPPQRGGTVPAFLARIIKRDAVSNRDMCPVTLEEFTEEIKAAVTPCFHLFTEAGLCAWLDTKGECPTCKAGVDKDACLFL